MEIVGHQRDVFCAIWELAQIFGGMAGDREGRRVIYNVVPSADWGELG